MRKTALLTMVLSASFASAETLPLPVDTNTQIMNYSAEKKSTLERIEAEVKAIVMGYSQSSRQAYENVANGDCENANAFANPFDFCQAKSASADFSKVNTLLNDAGNATAHSGG